MDIPRLANQPTQLYRCFDKNDTLLYVGISVDFPYRLHNHRKLSKWFEDIAKLTITHYPNRVLAFQAEEEAIREENPIYNINRTYPEPKPTIFHIDHLLDDLLGDAA